MPRVACGWGPLLQYVRMMTEFPKAAAGEPRTYHRYRSEVLEQAVRMEHLMGGAIAAAYGQNASTAQELQAEILGRLPIQQRISILGRILDNKELSGSFAFVIPVLKKLFELRNDLAHSVTTGYDAASRKVTLVSLRKGTEVRTSYEAVYLHWLLYEQCPAVERELSELYFLIAPGTEAWHEA